MNHQDQPSTSREGNIMDMLVKLYEIDAHKTLLQISGVEEKNDVIIRRAMAYEKETIVEFVRKFFTKAWGGWPSECDGAFSNRPLSCFIATGCIARGRLADKTADRSVIGFACYDATCRGFFGPFGVLKPYRGRGIGSGLLFSSLFSMQQEGYGYAIIGGLGRQKQRDFYSRAVGAIEIAGSDTGVYRDMLGGIGQ